MLRAGVIMRRFNDDYVIKAESIGQVRRELVTLERSLRDLGLILNHEKTQVLSAEQYEKGLSAYQKLLEEAAIETVELPAWVYVRPRRVRRYLARHRRRGDHRGGVRARARRPAHRRRQGVMKPYPYLASTTCTAAAAKTPRRVVARDVRNVNLYLGSLIGTEHEQAVVDTVVAVLKTEPLVLPWVQGWLVDVLAAARARPGLRRLATKDGLLVLGAVVVRGRALIALHAPPRSSGSSRSFARPRHQRARTTSPPSISPTRIGRSSSSRRSRVAR